MTNDHRQVYEVHSAVTMRDPYGAGSDASRRASTANGRLVPESVGHDVCSPVECAAEPPVSGIFQILPEFTSAGAVCIAQTQSHILAILATPCDADVEVDDAIIATPEGDVLNNGATVLAPRVSSASRRLRALAALSGSLTDALTPDGRSHRDRANNALGKRKCGLFGVG